MSSVVSWSRDGKSFTIHDPSTFMRSVFTVYFDSMTFGSFEQKLKRFGFSRSPAKVWNVDKDAKIANATYSQPCFERRRAPTISWATASPKGLSTIRPEHNFLFRLRVMLNDASREGNQLIVSWLPHGKGFTIHDRSSFTDVILPRYFKGKFTSLRQALRNHGFAQMGGCSWDEGGHYHKFFCRDDPLMCQGLTQEQMKRAMPNYVPSTEEPNFYGDDKEKGGKTAESRDPTMLEVANSIVSLKSLSKIS